MIVWSLRLPCKPPTSESIRFRERLRLAVSIPGKRAICNVELGTVNKCDSITPRRAMSDRRQSIYRQNRLPGQLRTISRDRRLSGNAVGLYLYLIDRPLDWEISTRAIVNTERFGGRDKVRRILHELIEAGYMQEDRQRFDDGRFRRGIYLLADSPRWAEVAAEAVDIQPDFQIESTPSESGSKEHNPATANQGVVKEESRVNRTTEQNQGAERPAKGSAVRGVASGAIAKPAHVRNIEQRRAQLVEAAGLALCEPDRTPALKDCRTIGYWLRTCRYSFSQDVLPTVRVRADRCAPGQVRSWSYFDKAIAEWHAKRTGAPAPATKPESAAGSDVMARVFAEAGLGSGWRK